MLATSPRQPTPSCRNERPVNPDKTQTSQPHSFIISIEQRKTASDVQERHLVGFWEVLESQTGQCAVNERLAHSQCVSLRDQGADQCTKTQENPATVQRRSP